LIRPEDPTDAPAIREVNVRAFGGPEEAQIVDQLRGVADPYISLVADLDGQVVGHILFTRVTIRKGPAVSDALGLAPMAVVPERQRCGIGSSLVRAGLEACVAASETVVFVVGDPEYYGRFGFRLAAPLGLRFRSPEFDPAFQVMELGPGALQGRTGVVEYLPPFEGA
jgi:putative acetyltransferase